MPPKKTLKDKAVKYGKNYLRKLPRKIARGQAVGFITDNGHSVGSVPIFGSVNKANTHEEYIERIQSEMAQQGVPEKFRNYHKIGDDYSDAKRRGDTDDEAYRYANQKAKGRWLDQRPQPQRIQSNQTMNTQSVPQGSETHMMYKGDNIMPSKLNNLPENTVLPAVMSPEVIAMHKQLLKQLKGSKAHDMMIKHPKDWTQEELLQAMRERERTNDPALKEQMFKREREWFDNAYGTQEIKYDETGKMIQPQMIRSLPQQAKPIKTKDDQDLDLALEGVVKQMPSIGDFLKDASREDMQKLKGQEVRITDGKYLDPKYKTGPQGTVNGQPVDDTHSIMPVGPQKFEQFDMAKLLPSKSDPEIVKGIQSGLNILSNKQNQSPLPSTVKQVKLKEDGVAGPKTSFGLKKALVENGTGKVSEALALGQFKETVKKAKKDGPQNLADELGASFAPLLPKKKTPKEGFQTEGLALQDTLNDFGADLKDDGIVGPKTTEAFGQIAKKTDEDELTGRFAYNLGFDF